MTTTALDGDNNGKSSTHSLWAAKHVEATTAREPQYAQYPACGKASFLFRAFVAEHFSPLTPWPSKRSVKFPNAGARTSTPSPLN